MATALDMVEAALAAPGAELVRDPARLGFTVRRPGQPDLPVAGVFVAALRVRGLLDFARKAPHGVWVYRRKGEVCRDA